MDKIASLLKSLLLNIKTFSAAEMDGLLRISISCEMRSSMSVYSPESKKASGFVYKPLVNSTIRSSFQFKQKVTLDLGACY